jgi:uncharacterized protein (DUF1800 family)
MPTDLLQLGRRCARTACVAALALGTCAASGIGVDEARHLLARTGFGAAPHEIRALLPLTREQAVDRLLASLDQAPALAPPPSFLAEPIDEYLPRLGVDYVPAAMAAGTAPAKVLTAAEQTALAHRGMQEMEQLRVWWLDRMVSTPAPFAERLVLFWHGHFTSRYFDVLGPRLMYDQLETLRTHGTHNFAALLHAMVRDPALLVFLDNAVNTRRTPNENLARELLELFTLGVGHYGEEDVKALARILAGHSIDFAGDWRYLVRQEELDASAKHFLGRDGVHTLDDAERVILEHPRTAHFIAEKFYREFVAPDIDEREVKRLAGVLRQDGYAIRPFLRTLLLGKPFWAPENRGTLVKSPVELLVSFVRTIGLPMADLGMLAQDSRLLGQDLFEPPSVEGWKQGMAWLTHDSLAWRADRLATLWRCRGAGHDWLNHEPGDVLVRFSAEREGAAPVRLRVMIDGVETAGTIARCPSESTGAGQAAAKPGWDLLRIRRANLPAQPRLIDVVFERAPAEKAFVFVNWVQVHGRRLPAHLAEVRFDPGQPCTGQEPKGMMYCPGHMRFDLAEAQRLQAGRDATLYDRSHGPVNAVIESATVRLPLVLRPGGRTLEQLRESIPVAWQGLPMPHSVLAVPPVSATPGSRGRLHGMETLFFDPAFNLK